MLKIKILFAGVVLFLGTVTFTQKFKLVDNNDYRLSFMGRVGQTHSSANFYWCGTSVQIKVKNSPTIKVVLGENINLNYYDVIIDGKYTEKIKVLKGKDTYTVASNLDNGSMKYKF